MTRLAARRFQFALVCCLGLLPVTAARAQALPILKDDFETGTADTPIPITGPWRVNDISQTLYRVPAVNPFHSGSVYADLLDPGTGTAPSQATRLMSSDAADTGGYSSKLATKVTTFSFDFYEPLPDVVDAQPGLGFGYYRLGAVDLNAGGRNFRAFLHNGMLSPDALVAGTGAAVAYEHEKVNTVFMLTNDTVDSPVVEYSPGHTLAPLTADVWISLDGVAPVFAFSVSKQNPGLTIGGIGFRTFNPDQEDIFIDNVLAIEGASFDRSAFNAPAGQVGDYDGDHDVDGNDFLLWQRQLGTAVPNGTGADGSGNGLVEADDLPFWKSHFGETSVVSAATSVPEPCVAALVLPLMGFFRFRGVVRTRS